MAKATTKKKTTKKDVAVTEQQSTSVEAWGDYAGTATGFEDTDKSELAIPFINLLQSNSKVVEDGDAQAGQLFNNVMETIHDSITIVPCARQRVFIEWVPHDDGGGLVAVHQPDSQFVVAALAANGGDPRGLKCDDGKHDLVETIQLYVLIVNEEGDYERAVIGFSSTKLKPYRHFFTKATSQMMSLNGRKFQLPLWAHRWKVGTVTEISKKNGKKFHNLNMSWDGDNAKECRMTPADELFQAASEFHDMVVGGTAKADMTTADKADSGGAASDGDIPF